MTLAPLLSGLYRISRSESGASRGNECTKSTKHISSDRGCSSDNSERGRMGTRSGSLRSPLPAAPPNRRRHPRPVRQSPHALLLYPSHSKPAVSAMARPDRRPHPHFPRAPRIRGIRHTVNGGPISVSTRNTPSSTPLAACIPFSGLGFATEAVEAVALALRPCREIVPAATPRPTTRPFEAHGYALQCRLGRETRAG